MQTNSVVSPGKNPTLYVPQNDADILKFSRLFIRQKWKDIILLGIIWIPIFISVLIFLWLISSLTLSGILWSSIFAFLWSSNSPDTTVMNSLSNLAIPLLIGLLSFGIFSGAIIYFTYVVYQTSVLYLTKGFIYQDANLSFLKAFSMAFSKIQNLLIIYFWRVIYTIIIPNLPYITGFLLLIWGASPVLYSSILIFAGPFATVYGIYIWVKTVFVLVYPVDKERRDWNSFFEALDFTTGRWFYIFSLLIIVWLIIFLIGSFITNLGVFVAEKLDIAPLQFIISLSVWIIFYYIHIFWHSLRYFIFKRIEQQKLAQKNV